MKSSRSSVRRTSAQANAVIKTGRSLLAGKTKARSMETTSSTSEILERKATHVAVDSKGNLERFFSTSLRTQGLAISFQPWSEAISRIALEAPDLERQAARRTLVSRKMLTLLREIFCIPLRHQQPTCRWLPWECRGQEVAHLQHREGGSAGKQQVPSSPRWEEHRQLLQFPRANSCENHIRESWICRIRLRSDQCERLLPVIRPRFSSTILEFRIAVV